jgi:hypothetical protein
MEPTFEYTENNHYKWGFGDEWYNRPNPEQKYKIHLGYTTRPVMRFREECIDVAKKIHAKATKPICVGLSGGGDSQMVCLAFRAANIPFKCVIVRMYDKDGVLVNDFDIKVAYKFCQRYSIEYMNFDLDLEEFYHGKGAEYAEKYGLTGVHTIVQCATMDYVCPDYCFIMAGGDIVMSILSKKLYPESNIESMPFNPKWSVPAWWHPPVPILQHMIEMGYEGTSKFYLYTPEILAAYLTDPVVKDFLHSKFVIHEVFMGWKPKWKTGWWKIFQMMYKPLMTMREWPEMIASPKMTGFENLAKATEDKPNYEAMYQKVIDDASNGVSRGQAVVISIEDLIDYITIPHSHNLEATKRLHILID